MVSPFVPKVHIEFSQDERGLISLPIGKTDFTKEELLGFLDKMKSASETSKAAPLRSKITKVIDTLWEKDTNKLKLYDPNVPLDREQLRCLYEAKQRILHSLREQRAEEVKDLTQIVSEERSEIEENLHAITGNLLQNYDTKIQLGVEEIVRLQIKLLSFNSYDHLEEIGRRLARSNTFEEFAWAYQDVQISARAIGKEDKLAADKMSQLTDTIVSKTATLLDAERKKVREGLRNWNSKSTFNRDETNALFLEIAKLLRVSKFAEGLIPHATKERKAIEQSIADVKQIPDEFGQRLEEKLRKEVQAKEDKSQTKGQAQLVVKVRGAEVARLSGTEMQLTVVTGTRVENALQYAAQRLISFDSISHIADLKAGVSNSVLSALKVSYASSAVIQNVTTLAGELACIYLLSGSNTEFLYNTGMYAVNALVTPRLVHMAAQKAGLERYEPLLVPVARVALPMGVSMAARQVSRLQFTTPLPTETSSQQQLLVQNVTANVTVTPKEMAQAPSMSLSEVSNTTVSTSPPVEMPAVSDLLTPAPAATTLWRAQEDIQVQAESAKSTPEAPQPSPELDATATPPPSPAEAQATAVAAAAPPAAEIAPQDTESLMNSAWKAVKAFSDFSIKYSPYNLVPDALKPYVQIASMQTLASGDIGTTGQTGSTK